MGTQLSFGFSRDLWYHNSTNQNETSSQPPSQSQLIVGGNVENHSRRPGLGVIPVGGRLVLFWEGTPSEKNGRGTVYRKDLAVKRRQTVVFAFLVLCLIFVPGQVRLVNSSTLPPRRAQEINQQCGHNCQMSIAPGSPTENDMIQVTVSGEWSNSCAPLYQSYQVVDDLIRVDAVVTGGPICLDVITPWGFSVDIGPLPGGFYRVDLYSTDAPRQVPATLCATQSLVVLSSSTVLITAVYYDTYLTNDPDEAFRLMNVSASTIDLTDWTVTDGEGTVTLTGTLGTGQDLWITRKADDFSSEFGFSPDYEYGADTDPAVPNLALTGNLTLANTGDQLILKDDTSALVDSVVYEGGSTTGTDWSGAGVEPYGQGHFGIEGQIRPPACRSRTPTQPPTGRRAPTTTSTARRSCTPAGTWMLSSSLPPLPRRQ
jgi:hypothetical protein